MDIDLQGTDAFDATQYIKTRLPATKVIMLSVLEGETYRKAAAKYGADAFLPKGAEISELLSVIGGGARPRGGTQDRKSTRLNSSHGYISYAVFCLKKKKKKMNTGLTLDPE